MEMIRREKEFREWFKVAGMNYGFFVQPIETSTGTGIPDTYVCIDGKPLWIELKCDERTTAPLIRKEQRVWGVRHDRALGRTLLAQLVLDVQTVYIWKQPIAEVRKVGKFLQVLDPPHLVVLKREFCHALVDIVTGVSDA